MFIYVSMMIWTALCGIVSKGNEINYVIEGRNEKRTAHIFAFLTFAYIVFFMGSVCGINDLTAYERNFAATPSEPSEIPSYMESVTKYPAFYWIQIFFKTYISTKFYHFTTLIVAFDCFVIAYVFRKYSPNFSLSVFLLISSGRIFWLCNGIKQFLATCIILLFSKYLMEKKFIPFAIAVIIASFFHTSALVVLPIYFFVHGKPWNKKMLLILVASILAVTFVSSFTNILGEALEGTDYDGSYVNAIESGNGSSILHFLIAAIPALIALVTKKKTESLAPSYINVCINMSIITACLYLIASFTSGILIGRLPVYFQLYSFISLPWLIENSFEKDTGKLIKIVCIVCYLILYFLIFFKTPYYSTFLNIYITP